MVTYTVTTRSGTKKKISYDAFTGSKGTVARSAGGSRVGVGYGKPSVPLSPGSRQEEEQQAASIVAAQKRLEAAQEAGEAGREARVTDILSPKGDTTERFREGDVREYAASLRQSNIDRGAVRSSPRGEMTAPEAVQQLRGRGWEEGAVAIFEGSEQARNVEYSQSPDLISVSGMAGGLGMPQPVMVRGDMLPSSEGKTPERSGGILSSIWNAQLPQWGKDVVFSSEDKSFLQRSLNESMAREARYTSELNAMNMTNTSMLNIPKNIKASGLKLGILYENIAQFSLGTEKHLKTQARETPVQFVAYNVGVPYLIGYGASIIGAGANLLKTTPVENLIGRVALRGTGTGIDWAVKGGLIAGGGMFAIEAGTEIARAERLNRTGAETAGGIFSTRVLPAFVGYSAGKYSAEFTLGEIRGFGLKPLEARSVIAPEYYAGQRYPQVRAGQTAGQLLKEFKPKPELFPGESKAAGYTASPAGFAKRSIIQPGASELPGLYQSPDVSPVFLRVGVQGQSPLSLFSFDYKASTPTILRTTPELGYRLPPFVKPWQRDLASIGRVAKYFEEGKVRKGESLVAWTKTEKEAIIPAETPLEVTQKRFYIRYQGIKVPIYEAVAKAEPRAFGEPFKISSRTLGEFFKSMSENRLGKYPMLPAIASASKLKSSSSSAGKSSFVSRASRVSSSEVISSRVSSYASMTVSRAISRATSRASRSSLSYARSSLSRASRASSRGSYYSSSSIISRASSGSRASSAGSRGSSATKPYIISSFSKLKYKSGASKVLEALKIQKFKSLYFPSLEAEIFGIRGYQPSKASVASGLTVRPILRGKKWAKKQ